MMAKRLEALENIRGPHNPDQILKSTSNFKMTAHQPAANVLLAEQGDRSTITDSASTRTICMMKMHRPIGNRRSLSH